MAYQVVITHTGNPDPDNRIVASICRLFYPAMSYVDTPVFEEGYKVGDAEEDKIYGKSVYATNVDGFGFGAFQYTAEDAMIPVPFPAAVSAFRFSSMAEDGKVTLTVDSWKEAAFYKEVGEALAAQGFTVEVTEQTEPEPGTAEAGDEASFNEAVADPTISKISVTAPMSVTAESQITREITLEGNGNTVTTDAQGKVFTLTAGGTVSDININSTADNTDWHSSYGLQFYTGEGTVSNVKISGCNAAIIVNGATVTLDGTVDVSNNTFGGIEVSKGAAAGLSAGVLNINGANLINTTEEYGKPTIWIDGNTDEEGVVNGAEAMTMVEVPHGDDTQKQFYLEAANAKPFKVGTNAYDTFAEAVAAADGTAIEMKADTTENVTIPCGKTTIIEGNGHTIKGVITLQSGTQGQTGALKVSNANFDGESTKNWALFLQNQTETAGQSSFNIEFTGCNIANYTKKAMYITEATQVKLTDCTFTNCATVDMNDPNTYGDYVVDCNLVGVKDVVVEMTGCTFTENGAQKASIKVTQRGGESDEGASDMPKGITATVQSFTVTGCTFNDTVESAKDVQIGSDNKSASTNPDAENTTGDFGTTTISGSTTTTSITTAYDGQSYELEVGQSFTRTGAGEPVIA